jgi:hypothetical protein
MQLSASSDGRCTTAMPIPARAAAERIRDKIAASKAEGMWMDGTPPLGYKPDGGEHPAWQFQPSFSDENGDQLPCKYFGLLQYS